MTPKHLGAFVLAGILWGAIAYWLGVEAYGPGVWAGVLVGPVIGLIVGSAMHKHFQQGRLGRRWLIALGSLYLGATLFGTVTGIYGVLAQTPGAPLLEIFWEGLATALYGVTLFIWVLLPLAYLTHVALGRITQADRVARAAS
jgi:hypothetical protein